jgi:uncharacterized cupredoxin-like copper-binding protein
VRDDDDDDGGDTTATTEATADATEITVTADEVSKNEFSFELSATPTAETETVVFDNQGELDHALVFAKINEGFTVDEAFELEGRQGSAETLIDGAGARPGNTETVEITEPIEPGNYVMLCPIPGPGGEPHYKLGQFDEFTIE